MEAAFRVHDDDAKTESLLLHHADIPLQSVSMARLAEKINAGMSALGHKQMGWMAPAPGI